MKMWTLRACASEHSVTRMIYSEAFDRLPDEIKAHVYQRLWDILTGKDTKPEYEKLTPETRRAILAILCDTKPGLPDYWKAVPSATLVE